MLPEPAELAGPGVSLTPPPPQLRPALDAAAAYQRAARQGGAATARPTVGLAMATTRLSWDDDGPVERLVYMVQWHNVSWMPSGPPRPDGRGHGPAVGTRTVLVDAGTGALLLHNLTGTQGGSSSRERERPHYESLLTRWAERPGIDPRAAVKAVALAGWTAREVREACAADGAEAVVARLAAVGADFGRRLRALDDAIGPFLHASERAEITADLQRMVSTAEEALGHRWPEACTALIGAATTAIEKP